jgi:TonB family protein
MKVTDDDIERYRRGELSAAQRHALEKKALSDPFLADALEGAEEISSDEFSKDVAGLSEKILPRKTLFTPLRIAAGLLVVIAGGWVSLSLLNQPDTELLTSSEKKSQKSVAQDSAAREEQIKDEKKDQLLTLKREDKKEVPQTERPRVPPTVSPELASRDGGAGAKPSEEPVQQQAEIADAGPVSEQEAARDSIRAPVAQTSKTQGLASEQPEEQSRRASSGSTLKKQADFIPSDDAKAKKDESDGRKIITGKVMMAEDDLALPGVNVRVKGSSQGTVTDLNGNYSLEVVQANPTLVFSFIGLQTQEGVPGNSRTLDIKLAEDVSQLSEVVVTGTAVPADLSSEPVIKLAEPVGGLRAYDKYLDGNLRYPQQAIENNIKGRVYIQFTVSVDGSLGEFKVMKSLGYGCDEEVIRLVKEGPAWVPSTENNIPTESLVRVKMKFDPSKRK